MVKNNPKCWYCGKLTMEPAEELGGDWLKCSSCGATDMPNPTRPTFSVLNEPKEDATGHVSRSPRAVRR